MKNVNVIVQIRALRTENATLAPARPRSPGLIFVTTDQTRHQEMA